MLRKKICLLLGSADVPASALARMIVTKFDAAPLVSALFVIFALAASIQRIKVSEFYSGPEKWATGMNPQPLVVPNSHPQIAQMRSHQTGATDSSHRRQILVFDAWERMVNVQGCLKRLVQLGIDARFDVVEPFVYESQVSKSFAVPDQFKHKGLKPQTASWYFDTTELFDTRHFITFDEFASFSFRQNDQIFIDAALHVDWEGKFATSRGFYWCDHVLNDIYRLQRIDSSSSGARWRFSTNVTIGRALCVSPQETMRPNSFNHSYFDSMFEAVAREQYILLNNTGHPQGANRNLQKTSTISIALLNYRKHAFSGYISATGAMPFKQENPPMKVGPIPHQIAMQFREKHFRGRPYVSFQLRTGKAWVLSGATEEVFIQWLNTCIDKSLIAIKIASSELGPNPAVYIASDMYNNGWKGGEKCPEQVCSAIEKAKKKIERELNPDIFVPAEFGIIQDEMGTASAVDAAMSVAANRFVFALPSNMGKWVQDQRRLQYLPETTTVNCNIFKSN